MEQCESALRPFGCHVMFDVQWMEARFSSILYNDGFVVHIRRRSVTYSGQKLRLCV